MSSILVGGEPDPADSWNFRRWIGAGLLLAVLVLLAYGPTLSHEFVWDDHEQVVDNPYLRHWSNLPELWRHDVLTLSRADGESRSNYYRPLFFTQYLVYFQLFELNTTAWHGLALLQHWFACLAVLIFLRAMGRSYGLGFGPALATACLFAVHPVHGESVSWIAAAFNDPPAAALLLLGLAAHAHWRRGASPMWLLASALAYASSLALKEAALSMLFLIPLVDSVLDRVQGGPRKAWFRLVSAIPFGTLVVANFLLESKSGLAWFSEHPFRALPLQLVGVLGLSALALRWLGKRYPRALPQSPWSSLAPYVAVTLLYFAARKAAILTLLGVYPGGLTAFDLIPSIPRLVLFYLKALVWPWGLAPSYPLRLHEGWNGLAVFQGLFLVALGGIIWWAARRNNRIAFASLWTAACALPALNVLSFRPQYLVHQRYLYLASLGVCCLAAWATYRWITHRRARVLLLSLLILVGIASNLYHNRFWATDEALWSRVAQVDPANAAAFDWLGNNAMQAERIDEAEELFRGSLKAEPAGPYGLCNLGTVLFLHRKNAPEALPYLERGAHAFADPEYPRNLQAAFDCRLNLSSARASSGNPDQAIQELLTLFNEPPHRPQAARNLAVLLVQQGRLGKVETVLRQALKIHPQDSQLQNMLRDVLRWKSTQQADSPNDAPQE